MRVHWFNEQHIADLLGTYAEELCHVSIRSRQHFRIIWLSISTWSTKQQQQSPFADHHNTIQKTSVVAIIHNQKFTHTLVGVRLSAFVAAIWNVWNTGFWCVFSYSVLMVYCSSSAGQSIAEMFAYVNYVCGAWCEIIWFDYCAAKTRRKHIKYILCSAVSAGCVVKEKPPCESSRCILRGTKLP